MEIEGNLKELSLQLVLSRVRTSRRSMDPPSTCTPQAHSTAQSNRPVNLLVKLLFACKVQAVGGVSVLLREVRTLLGETERKSKGVPFWNQRKIEGTSRGIPLEF